MEEVEIARPNAAAQPRKPEAARKRTLAPANAPQPATLLQKRALSGSMETPAARPAKKARVSAPTATQVSPIPQSDAPSANTSAIDAQPGASIHDEDSAIAEAAAAIAHEASAAANARSGTQEDLSRYVKEEVVDTFDFGNDLPPMDDNPVHNDAESQQQGSSRPAAILHPQPERDHSDTLRASQSVITAPLDNAQSTSTSYSSATTQNDQNQPSLRPAVSALPKQEDRRTSFPPFSVGSQQSFQPSTSTPSSAVPGRVFSQTLAGSPARR